MTSESFLPWLRISKSTSLEKVNSMPRRSMTSFTMAWYTSMESMRVPSISKMMALIEWNGLF